MKDIMKIAATLTLVCLAGCNQDAKTEKTDNSDILKTQRDTLEQAKQVEQVIRNADDRQQQLIEKEAQSSGG